MLNCFPLANKQLQRTLNNCKLTISTAVEILPEQMAEQFTEVDRLREKLTLLESLEISDQRQEDISR